MGVSKESISKILLVSSTLKKPLKTIHFYFETFRIKNNKMYSFLKAFLVLMKLLSLAQFYAPKF